MNLKLIVGLSLLALVSFLPALQVIIGIFLIVYTLFHLAASIDADTRQLSSQLQKDLSTPLTFEKGRDVEIVGESFYYKALKIIDDYCKDNKIPKNKLVAEVKRDVGNQYDKNAIGVSIGDYTVG